MSEKEDEFDAQLERASGQTLEQNLVGYFEFLADLYARQGIDYYNHPVKKSIYFVEDKG